MVGNNIHPTQTKVWYTQKEAFDYLERQKFQPTFGNKRWVNKNDNPVSIAITS